MQYAIVAAFLGGIACSTIGVFVVLMKMAFIGVLMAHAAFAGAIVGVWAGFDPIIGAFAFSLGVAAVIGPLADRGELNPDTSIGIMFSLMLGLSFLFIGLIPGPKTEVWGLLWGSILTITTSDLLLLAVVATVVLAVVLLFYKEIKAFLFNREMALAVGLPATVIFYGLMVLTGGAITASLRPIGGMLIFSLIINPAAAAYQLTYSLRRMFLLSATFGVLSGWIGLFVSYAFDAPSGAVIVIVSSVIFALATIFSPKRKIKKFQEELGVTV